MTLYKIQTLAQLFSELLLWTRCATGLDFVLKNKYKYPDDYPELGALVTVTGKFERYVEGEDTCYHLTDADLIKQ